MTKFSLRHLLQLVRLHAPTRSRWSVARRLIVRANSERDARVYPVASALYEEALRIAPDAPRMRMQYAHMLKEAGDLAAAAPVYQSVAAALPDDPDVAIQLGHFYKVAGQRDEAEAAYLRATLLRPGWVEAEQELAQIRGGGDASMPLEEGVGAGLQLDRLAAELVPSGTIADAARMREGFFLRRLGANRAMTRSAYRRVLRGVEAIHGFAISDAPIEMLELLIDGERVHRERAAAPLRLTGGQGKTVFNIWFDFSDWSPGPYQIELKAWRTGAGELVHRAQIDVMPPLSEEKSALSDAIVGTLDRGNGTIEERVNVRPSMIRAAPRSFLAPSPRAILVQRVDQLGDFVCTIPAIERLRALFPEARLVGLVTAGNAALARSVAGLDDVVVVDFPEESDGRRVMDLHAQEALRLRLAPYRFDMAIDLCEGSGTRPLLRLSGAPFLYGFKDNEFPWLSAGFELTTHDAGNHREALPVAHKLVAMVDALSALVARPPMVVRRTDMDRRLIANLGIHSDTRFAVLHHGARLPGARWPGFTSLAKRLLAETDLTLVVMGDEDLPDLPDDPRVIRAPGLMDFDRFDALLHHCSLFVGNDSGPKHLASLRGAPTVSVHMARNNWSEWGQEASGLIVSRRVPCAGCGIPPDGDECGKQFSCIRQIRTEEVFEAATRLL